MNADLQELGAEGQPPIFIEANVGLRKLWSPQAYDLRVPCGNFRSCSRYLPTSENTVEA